jgi:acyl carrier protein
MEERLRQILAEVFEDGNMAKTVSLDTDLVHDVGLDSLKMIKLLLRTEDEFDIEIDYDNLNITSLTSLRRFCEYIRSRTP